MTWFFCFLKNRAVLYIHIFAFALLITFKGKHFNYFYFYTFTYFMYKLFLFRPLYLFLGQQKSNDSVSEVLASSTNFYCWSEIYNSAFLQGFLTLVHILLYRNVHDLSSGINGWQLNFLYLPYFFHTAACMAMPQANHMFCLEHSFILCKMHLSSCKDHTSVIFFWSF